MKRTIIEGAVFLCGVLLAGTAYPAAVSLGYAAARPGGSVEITVNVSAETDLGGVNVRLEYDPGVFSSAIISGAGTLLDVGHSMQFSSPAAGRINAVAWAPAGTSPFKARSGIVFTVILQVDPSVAMGTYPISFTGAGPVILASSGLSDMNGNSIPHTVQSGTVDVRSALVCDVNGDGQVNYADLIMLLREWHDTSEVPFPLSDINWDCTVNEEDLMMLQGDWQKPPPPPAP
jgi:hypothetical protein